MQTNQTPEALAEEIKKAMQASLMSDKVAAQCGMAVDRLRDMAASGAKECAALQRDAERYQAIRAANDENDSEELCLGVVKNAHFDFVSTGAELDRLVDAAIAATKRG